MRILDGLATLAETGAYSGVKPSYLDDVFGLAGAFQSGTNMPPVQAAQPLGVPEDQELLVRTRNKGFSFAAIRERLLGSAVDLGPTACRSQCLSDSRCAAWEVCAPVDSRTGCDGCYLIG